MRTVLLDARVAVGGTRRYIEVLREGLKAEGSFEVALMSDGGWSRAPFTPWGRRKVDSRARAIGAELIHGCHVEVPRTRIPTVATVHDLIPFDHPASLRNPIKRTIYERAVQTSLKHATQIIAVSSATADQLLARGVSASRVTVVPNGVAPAFSPLVEVEKEAARRRFANGKQYVAALMTPKSHKNCSVLNDVVAPDGIEFVRLRSGELDETSLRLFYGGGEVFVLPSLIEGFGYPLVEALACGTPVICGPGVGGINHVEGGYVLADPSRPRGLTDALAGLLRDEVRRKELSAAGLTSVRSLTPEAMAIGTAAVYELALE